MDRPPRAKRTSWLNDQRVRGLADQTLLLAGIERWFAARSTTPWSICASAAFRWASASGTISPDRHQSPSDWLFQSVDLRAGVLGRAAQHSPHCGHLHSIGDAAGFRAIGVARLSPNWLLSRFALVYTSVMRNIPLLLLLLFWYNAVLKSLPGPRQSSRHRRHRLLNNRGLYLPMPVACDSAVYFLGAVLSAIALA